MLVTFSCKAYADITMFGDVAVSLLKLMGHSGTVPGALAAEEVSVALERLRAALAEQAQSEVEPRVESDETPVSLAHRAMPLVALLEAALDAHTHVMWDS
jgi:ATP phosphoribosyltransferase regulatory subunit HisZ